jgi:nitric oxide reductase subunit B
MALAFGATFSALEVVPLTLITLDAWDFVKVTRGDNTSAGFRHRWTFYFLMSVGFWNFVGAGVFGFLINMPIVSYYEIGTTLTVNHGHAAFVGVFGMLGVALMAYVLRELASDAIWPRVEKCLKVCWWGLNVGLAMMVMLSLLPNGLLQLWDVIENGYWHARSVAHTGSPLPKFFEWMRTPGDLVFIFAGVVPLVWGLWIAWLDLRRRSASM